MLAREKVTDWQLSPSIELKQPPTLCGLYCTNDLQLVGFPSISITMYFRVTCPEHSPGVKTDARKPSNTNNFGYDTCPKSQKTLVETNFVPNSLKYMQFLYFDYFMRMLADTISFLANITWTQDFL